MFRRYTTLILLISVLIASIPIAFAGGTQDGVPSTLNSLNRFARDPQAARRRGVHEEDPRVHDRTFLQLAADRLSSRL